MKKIIYFIAVWLCFNSLQANAAGGWGYKYFDAGGLYTGTTMPQSVSKNFDKSNADLTTLRRGESSARNILQLFEIGDASVNQAAKNGRITKVHFVDTQISKVYIPLGFIPIYAKEIKTVVYGE